MCAWERVPNTVVYKKYQIFNTLFIYIYSQLITNQIVIDNLNNNNNNNTKNTKQYLCSLLR